MTLKNLLIWVYMDNCKNYQQATCKKNFMPYWNVIGRTNNALSNQTLYLTNQEQEKSNMNFLLELKNQEQL